MLGFGGEKFDILYATYRDKVYSRKVQLTGYNTFDKSMKPKGPNLCAEIWPWRQYSVLPEPGRFRSAC